jgi:hypothetical protein
MIAVDMARDVPLGGILGKEKKRGKIAIIIIIIFLLFFSLRIRSSSIFKK